MRPLLVVVSSINWSKKLSQQDLEKWLVLLLMTTNQHLFPGKWFMTIYIIMAHELVRGYNWKNVCMIQIDIQKAYDMVEWKSLWHIIVVLGLWLVWRRSRTNFLNGMPSKTLEANRGLRQGDPISSMLFVLVWNIFIACCKG